jgi:hypothetical protein
MAACAILALLGPLVGQVVIPIISSGNGYVTEVKVPPGQTGETGTGTIVIVPASPAEEAVRALFSQTEGEVDFWNGNPVMAPLSKHLLIRQWPEFTLDHAHSFNALPDGPALSLSDLFYERVDEGRVVDAFGHVSGRPWNLASKHGVMKQSYEVETSGEAARLRCYTPRSVNHLLEEDDELEIKVISIAWSPPGSDEELTMAVCPAVRIR